MTRLADFKESQSGIYQSIMEMSDRCERFCETFVAQAEAKPYECDVCEMRFRHPTSLAIHKAAHNANRPYECDICLMRFTHSNQLIKHKKAHVDVGYQCDICKKILSRLDCLIKHRKTHTDNPHECDVCLTRFSELNELIKHKIIHTGDNPSYECSVCRTGFSELDLLLKHRRTHARWDRFHKCNVCPRTFDHVEDFDWHKKAHLYCSDCNKGIFEPQELQGHFVKNKHTGKYVCNKCYRHYANFVQLVEHIARLHTNDAKYQCGFCQELESTVPTGLGYICCVCDVVFEIPCDLEAHMITHNTVQAD